VRRTQSAARSLENDKREVKQGSASGESGDFRKGGGGVAAMAEDVDAEPVGGDGLEPVEALVADGVAVDQPRPGAGGFAVADAVARHALAQRDGLREAEDAERAGFGQADLVGRAVGLDARVGKEVVGEQSRQAPAEGGEALDVRVVEAAFGRGRHVEEQRGVAADGAEVKIDEVRDAAHGIVLGGAVEPAGADGNIDFAGTPDVAVFVAVLELPGDGELDGAGVHGAVGAGVAGEADERGVDHGPVGVAGDAAFVADPAHGRAAVAEDHGVGLEAVAGLEEGGPVVLLALAVRAFAAGAVEPDFAEFAVLGEQLVELGQVEGVVGGGVAVGGLVAIPRAEVEPGREVVAAAGVHEFADDVALALLPGRGLDGVVGEGARPEAEAVVVLGGEHHGLRARRPGGGGPLVGVEGGGVEDGRGRLAVAPFAVGEGVRAEMDEDREGAILPGELGGGGRRGEGREGAWNGDVHGLPFGVFNGGMARASGFRPRTPPGGGAGDSAPSLVFHGGPPFRHAL
jgi:hypothetical protein